MKVKVLEDFIYSLDGIRPTSFKKGDVVSSFNAKEVQKLTESGKIGPEKTKVSRQNSPPLPPDDNLDDKKTDENSDDKKPDEDSKDDKNKNPNLPPKPQANRDGDRDQGNQ